MPPSTAQRSRAMFIVFTALGTAFGVLAGALPAVTHAALIDKTTQGIGFTGYTIGYVLAMAVAGRIAARLGHRALLLAGLPMVLLTLAMLMSAETHLQFHLGLIGAGCAFGLVDVIMNAEVGAIEPLVGRPIFLRYHGVVSAGVAVFALVGSALAAVSGPLAPVVVLTPILLGAMIGVGLWTPAAQGQAAAATAPRSTSRPATALPWARLTLLGLAAGLIIAAETAAVFWSARLLDELAPTLAALAGLATAFYGACNAAVRLVGDRLRSRLGDRRLMLGSLALAIVGFLGVGVFASVSFLATVLLFALIGFATACLIPCVFAIASREMRFNPAAAIGYVSLIAGVPRALAPWLFGVLADAVSLSFAFGVCAIMLVVAITLVAKLRPPATDRVPVVAHSS